MLHARKKGTKEEYAIKKMAVSLLKEHNLISQIVKEVKIMYTLSKCEYVVRILDHFEDEDHIYLVMEMAKGVIYSKKFIHFSRDSFGSFSTNLEGLEKKQLLEFSEMSFLESKFFIA